jgi:probable F420-dependent oxidoreductase
MRFGFTIPTYNNRPAAPEQFDRAYRLCALAESVGFDFGMMGSHRFSPGASDPSAPLVLMAALAARTSRLRYLTAVLLLPLYNPLDVAEQVATLDCLSGGRVIVGVGVGYRRYEYDALGLAWHHRGARLDEGLEVLDQAWTRPSVTFAGRHFEFADVPVVPKPMQQPRPPIWVGAQARRAIARAATRADGWIAGYLESIPVLVPRVDEYRRAAADIDRPSTLCLMRKTGIRATRRQVEEAWLPRVVELLQGYRAVGARWPADREFWAKIDGGTATFDNVVADMMVAGTPDDCIREIARYRELTGCEYYLASFGTAGRTDEDDEQFARDLDLFGREVIPAFRD